jgi:hypothetical protein
VKMLFSFKFYIDPSAFLVGRRQKYQFLNRGLTK